MEVHNSGSMYYHYHHVQPEYPKLEINDVLFISRDNVYSKFFKNLQHIILFIIKYRPLYCYKFLGYLVKYSFPRGYTNKEEKPYNIFHSYSTTCHVLKAISNFPFFEDIPITKKNFIIYFAYIVCLLMYFKLYAKKCPWSI